MKWKADWWGITLTAENEEDATVIRDLSKRLPTDPDESYDGGKLETEKIETDEATIIFNR